MRIYMSVLSLLLAAMITTACERQGPMEEAGEKLDDATEEIGDSIEDACEETKEALGAEDDDC